MTYVEKSLLQFRLRLISPYCEGLNVQVILVTSSVRPFSIFYSCAGNFPLRKKLRVCLSELSMSPSFHLRVKYCIKLGKQDSLFLLCLLETYDFFIFLKQIPDLGEINSEDFLNNWIAKFWPY